ncbi:hypothetical protein EG68_05278 [Paragonimus skrjabini miyazakii]|uniref:Uncharacterized protein n=1 Tax=Paragonimus skrjabini miyazakii TaxID=59628 RepID=A0A8S9Z333_9TREM|nr:hypothetical protein EG68_05278 [Paragonimus skrjabini miyazakii]
MFATLLDKIATPRCFKVKCRDATQMLWISPELFQLPLLTSRFRFKDEWWTLPKTTGHAVFLRNSRLIYSTIQVDSSFAVRLVHLLHCWI